MTGDLRRPAQFVGRIPSAAMRSCGSRLAPVLALLLAACSPATADIDTNSTSTLPVGSLPGTVATTSPAGPTTSTQSPDELADQLAACVSSWPLRDRIALLVWPSVYSEQWATAQAVVSDLHVGGVILMKPGSAFAADLATHLAELDAAQPPRAAGRHRRRGWSGTEAQRARR